MQLNKVSVDDINVKGKKVLVTKYPLMISM